MPDFDIVSFLMGKAAGGGGGVETITKIASSENQLSTGSTSAAVAFTLQIGSQYFTKDKIIWVHIRDKAGKREGYFYGTDTFFLNKEDANGGTNTLEDSLTVAYRYVSSAIVSYIGAMGVFAASIGSDGVLTVKTRYNSSYSKTISGTFVTDVYVINPPSGVDLFA